MQDIATAEALFRHACEGGNPFACANLGLMYKPGDGVGRDPQQARALFELACERGATRACAEIGQ